MPKPFWILSWDSHDRSKVGPKSSLGKEPKLRGSSGSRSTTLPPGGKIRFVLRPPRKRLGSTKTGKHKIMERTRRLRM